jgi:uncharacterized protein YecE (DUF72 family)
MLSPRTSRLWKPQVRKELQLASHQSREETAQHPVYVGTAGWTLPRESVAKFTTDGTHLARYAQRFCAVEINSSFYKPHRPATYARWAASVPPDFRFAVKVPQEITHQRKLIGTAPPLARFLAEVSELKAHLGPLLVQLPPSLVFETPVARAFFACVRARFAGSVVCEPRHATWCCKEAEQLLADFQVARVAADPALVPQAAQPGGWMGLVYYRLHGSPRMYYSAYLEDALRARVQTLRETLPSAPAWCIFDNTALGAALGDALSIARQLK